MFKTGVHKLQKFFFDNWGYQRKSGVTPNNLEDNEKLKFGFIFLIWIYFVNVILLFCYMIDGYLTIVLKDFNLTNVRYTKT